ncbi:MAG: low-complexity tail membrane protein [Cyanobacteria bacterium M_surface_7_m2_037]|nr:low-complexity tail membrane protein [Cyanobacteria bacterium M_surface_7_m2_037]
MNPARREPLLWLQLLGLAALPLEALLLLLVLAGADPGPLPGFERILAWALGALAPAVLFWRLPPDLWSLLLLQVPLRGRRPEQLRLSALQTALPLKLIAASGAALLLPLVWLLDANAGLAWAWSPLSASPRLVVLLVSLPLLALMQWQWHQLMQTLWLFTRPAALMEQTLPLTQAQAAESRLNLGLPLLLLQPLAVEPTAAQQNTPPTPEPAPEPAPQPAPEAITTVAEEPEPEPSATADADADSSDLVVDAGVSVTPEEPAEEHESTQLDAKVAEGDGLPS